MNDENVRLFNDHVCVCLVVWMIGGLVTSGLCRRRSSTPLAKGGGKWIG